MNERLPLWVKFVVIIPWSLLVSFVIGIVPFTARFYAAHFLSIRRELLWPPITKFVVYTIPEMEIAIWICSISIFVITIICACKISRWSGIMILVLFCNWILWAIGIFYYLALNAVKWDTFI